MKTVKFSKCPQDKYPEFEHLHYYETGDKIYVDATGYLQACVATPGKSVDEFLELYKVWINHLASMNQIADEDVVLVNETDGHVLLDECLDLVLVAYADAIFCKWMLDRMEELMNYNVTVHDPYLQLVNKLRFGVSA